LAAQPVEAVWVWYFGKAAQKATYGRFDGDTSYTKDYLQVSGTCRDLMADLLPPNEGVERTNLTFRWPGGQAEGFVKHSVDRHHLTWRTALGVPAPWKLSTTPTSSGPGTIPGNPAGATANEANSHLQSFEDSGVKAYLMAVKLHGETDVLHIRAYIQDPTRELRFADTAALPEAIQAVVEKATPSRACASILLEGGGAALTPDVAEVLQKFEDNPNLLFVGPPGTGKTVLLERLTKYIENPGTGILFDPSKNHDAWSEASDSTVPGKTRTVVLHPSYSYDNLVLGLMPEPAATGGGVAIKVATGPLVNLAHYASTGESRAILILDEFNRGNAAAVLGDTLALLDKDKRGTAFVDLPYGDLPVDVPTEFAADGSTTISSRFTLPPNLWIAAAMNSSDRSVAPLDAALRRRFSIVEMPPDYEALSRHIAADADADLTLPWNQWTPDAVSQLTVSLLRALNERIDAVLGQDFRLGQSNFWHVSGQAATERLHSLAVAWDRRVAQTLRLALQDNDDLLGAILIAGTSAHAVVNNETQAAWWKASDSSLGTYGTPRLHFNELATLETGELHTELLRLAGL
jgi:5-methylcytosine-specific restriction protein B